VTGATARSLRAIANVKAVCEQYLKGSYDLEVLDIYRHPELLREDQIVAVRPWSSGCRFHIASWLVIFLARSRCSRAWASRHSRADMTMPGRSQTPSHRDEAQRLRARLLEVEETLRAIRSGEVDALVVETAGEDQVFTLQGADQTYRLIVEQMQKGAATLSEGEWSCTATRSWPRSWARPSRRVLGASLSSFLDDATDAYFSRLREAAARGVSRGEIAFHTSRGPVLTQVSITVLAISSGVLHCLIVTDLTERKRREEERLLLEHERGARAAAEDLHRMARIEIERRTRVEGVVASGRDGSYSASGS
jgi:hypothetical protein